MQSWDVEQIEEEVDQLDKKRDFLETGVRRPSAYVDVFESAFPFRVFSIVLTLLHSLAMVRTVLECEHHLLSDKEVEILEQFSKLCCEIVLRLVSICFLNKVSSGKTTPAIA